MHIKHLDFSLSSKRFTSKGSVLLRKVSIKGGFTVLYYLYLTFTFLTFKTSFICFKSSGAHGAPPETAISGLIFKHFCFWVFNKSTYIVGVP